MSESEEYLYELNEPLTLRDAERTRQEMEDALASLDERLDAIEKNRAEIANVNNQETNKKISTLEGEMAELQAENKALKEDIASLQAENKALKEEMAELRAEYDRYSKKIANGRKMESLEKILAAVIKEYELKTKDVVSMIDKANLELSESAIEDRLNNLYSVLNRNKFE